MDAEKSIKVDPKQEIKKFGILSVCHFLVLVLISTSFVETYISGRQYWYKLLAVLFFVALFAHSTYNLMKARKLANEEESPPSS